MRLLFFIGSVLFFIGCNPKEKSTASDNPDNTGSDKLVYSALDYAKWVESEDGLRMTKKIDKIAFQLQYMPKEYLVIKDYADSIMTLNENKLQQASKEYEELQYFKLRISIDDFNDEIVKYNIRNDFEYEERVKYYSFNMQHRLKLIDGKDTLPCVMYNYERTFNLTPNSNFQIAFPAGKANTPKTLILDDLYLGTGKIMIAFSQEKINSIPVIAF